MKSGTHVILANARHEICQEEDAIRGRFWAAFDAWGAGGDIARNVARPDWRAHAVTSVRIEGVAHEFSTIKGVTEDVTDIVLNLKGIVCRMHSDATEVEAPLVVTGPGEITAKDIDLPAGVEILNPDVHIATLEKKTKLELYLTVGRGRGYRQSEDNKSPDQPIGVIPIDSIFSPVRRVAYSVEQARVGQRTDYDKLVFDITTNGSVAPKDALTEAANILTRSLIIFGQGAVRCHPFVLREMTAARRSSRAG